MSEILYAQPDFTRNARIQGDAKEERNGGLYENTADTVIYDTVAVVGSASENLQKPTEDKLQEKRKLSRAAAVCLGLLAVLLLAAIIGLGIHYSQDKTTGRWKEACFWKGMPI
ncbi:hypothetical protein CRUP_000476 [Coryphaenoides rupestris]|nr:hypothetical protein CRUP_000476 [Coryphaenoides rupestris]